MLGKPGVQEESIGKIVQNQAVQIPTVSQLDIVKVKAGILAQHEYVQDELERETYKDVTDTKVSDNGEEKSDAVSRGEYEIVDPIVDINKTLVDQNI